MALVEAAATCAEIGGADWAKSWNKPDGGYFSGLLVRNTTSPRSGGDVARRGKVPFRSSRRPWGRADGGFKWMRLFNHKVIG